jgi:hypothetical protein
MDPYAAVGLGVLWWEAICVCVCVRMPLHVHLSMHASGNVLEPEHVLEPAHESVSVFVFVAVSCMRPRMCLRIHLSKPSVFVAALGTGIDDYIALTREVGYEPAITIRFQLGRDADVAEVCVLHEFRILVLFTGKRSHNSLCRAASNPCGVVSMANLPSSEACAIWCDRLTDGPAFARAGKDSECEETSSAMSHARTGQLYKILASCIKYRPAV